jgi:hypothetical protein
MVPKNLVRQLATKLVAYPLEFTGKDTFKEEFVTADGVDLKDINMKTMQSKMVPGLYFCGELINVGGFTGWYNFMNCWSTGYVAGEFSVEQLLERIKESKGADWKFNRASEKRGRKASAFFYSYCLFLGFTITLNFPLGQQV